MKVLILLVVMAVTGSGCIVTTGSYYAQQNAARRQVAYIGPVLDRGRLGVGAEVDLLALMRFQQLSAAEATLRNPYPWAKATGETALYAVLGGLIYYLDKRESERPETYRVDTGGGDFNQVGRDGSAGSPRTQTTGGEE